MKKNLTSYFIAFALSTILFSCKKDKEEVINDDNNKTPEIAFTTPENNAKVWNKITLETNTINSDEIEKTVFYIADKQVGEISTPPFDYVFDTKAYNDGPLEIRAIAHYKTGSQSEATLTVNILNTLFTFSVPENPGDAALMFLSDPQGNSLGIKSLEKGATVEFRRPDDFEDEIFNCNIIYESEYTVTVRTYTNVEILGKEGELKVAKSSKPVGNATIKLDMLGQDERLEFFGDLNPTGQYYECADCEIAIALTKEPANIFAFKDALSDSPYYAYIRDVKDGDVINLEQDDLIPMKKRSVPPSNLGYNTTFVTLFGNDNFGVDNDFFIGINYGPSSSDIEFYSPEEKLFKEYYTSYRMSGNNKNLEYFVLGEDFQPFAAPDFDINKETGTDTKIVGTASGEFDSYYAKWESRMGNIDYLHYVYGKPENQLTANRPTLPNEILEMYPSFKNTVFKPSYIGADDSYAIKSYNEYIEHHLGVNRNKEYEWNIHHITSAFED